MEPQKEIDDLQPLKELCTIAIADANLSSVKQKFRNFDVSAEISDPVLKISLEKDIYQILSSQTLERARHYIRILEENISDGPADSDSGLNIKRWKGYDDIYTDSLWHLGKRVSDGNHKAWYWGNFVPQIPFQLMSRFTNPHDWILDPFCGSGTTLVEARKLRRNSVGIELNPSIYQKTKDLLSAVSDDGETSANLELGDSLAYNYPNLASKYGIGGFRLAILHPPYWNIIKFSNLQEDLSNSGDPEEFTSRLNSLCSSILPAMLPESHIALVIGDLYRDGEVIPLGFRSMAALQELGLQLKGIIVKDIQNTKSKRSSENLWRYRALKSGFYVFKHEYVFVFRVRK